ncbi:MAG: sigma-70 family RNA polymerase sigma factor [Saccharospirillum sp.]
MTMSLAQWRGAWPCAQQLEEAAPVSNTETVDVDAQLVCRAQQGDRVAYDFLMVRYQHRVAGHLQSFVKNPQEVSDLTQETFLKAWQGLGSFRQDSQFYTWIYRIATNTALSYLARRKTTVLETDLSEASRAEYEAAPSEQADPEHDYAVNELNAVIQSAMDGLPDDQRETLHMREWQGMSYQDIAEALQVPVGTVRSRIHRARDFIDRSIHQWRSGGRTL